MGRSLMLVRGMLIVIRLVSESVGLYQKIN